MNEGQRAGQTSDERGRELSTFIEGRREDILRRWAEHARAAVPPANELSEPTLRDHMPALLEWAAEVLRRAPQGGHEPPEMLPKLHAESRFVNGYDEKEVVRELALLRQAVLEAWETEVAPHIAVRDAHGLNDAVDRVIARSVRVLADARKRDLQDHLLFEQQMIGVVSHDLQQPLSIILLVAEGLLKDLPDSRSTRGVLRIRNAAQRATRQIRDLLDFTRVRLGSGIPLTPRPCDVHAITRDVVAELGVRAENRDISVVAHGDGSAVLDADRVAQIVENLLGNALKYGAPGTCVTVKTQGEPEGVSLTVHNWGEPIPEEAHARLFQPLQRAVEPSSVEHRNDGLGLGLFIVQSIVLAHGGTVAVRSTAEEGTTFNVRLPREAARSGDKDGSAPAAGRSSPGT